LCDGGTLVLDEVNRLPEMLQERLAEFVATGSVRPIGAHHSFRVDIRLISASNCTLGEQVETQKFRKNLYKALSATRIVLPPLRERSGDIPALARYFLGKIGEQPGLRPLGITDGALKLLGAYEWPRNVRQLQAVLFRAAVFCDGDALTSEDFPQLHELIGEVGERGESLAHEGIGIQLYTEDGNLRPLEEIEADVIRLAIGHYRGRMTEVARRLGIGRSTLYRKLNDLGIGDAA
jgi:DNA-binding NtrC family response regulator